MIESFRRCPVPGCVVAVWGPTGAETRCKTHGGNRLDFPEIVEDDCWGEPTINQAAAGVPSTPAARQPSEAS